MPLAYVGLQITDAPPHGVCAVEDLIDVNFVRQGAIGYSNPTIRPSDRILQIDGQPAEHVSVEQVRRMLSGELHSPVLITLARGHGQGKHYSVQVLRHRMRDSYHTLPKARSTLEQASPLTLREQLREAQREVSEVPSVLDSDESYRQATTSRDADLKIVFLLDTAGESLRDPVFRRRVL